VKEIEKKPPQCSTARTVLRASQLQPRSLVFTMVKLTVSNLSSKVGKRVNMAKVEEIVVAKKQIDAVDFSLSGFKCLKVLDISTNRIRFPRQLLPVLDAPVIEELDLRVSVVACVRNVFVRSTLAKQSYTYTI
jgi:hypothetical protein